MAFIFLFLCCYKSKTGQQRKGEKRTFCVCCYVLFFNKLFSFLFFFLTIRLFHLFVFFFFLVIRYILVAQTQPLRSKTITRIL